MLPECFKSGSIARVDFEKLVQTTDLEDVPRGGWRLMSI